MRGDWTCNLSRLAVGPWAKAHGIPARVTGVGLMPIEGESLEFARRMAVSFDLFSVRDERTMEAINSDNLDVATLAPDDCFINGLEHCYMTGEPLPDIMLCIQSDFIEDVDALHRHVAKMLATWHVKDTDPIGVVECNPRIDRPIFDYLAAQGFSRLRFYPLAEVLECGFPAREGQRWISTRYHPHVLAAALGCSGSFICVDQQYYGIKHAAVLRMGSHWSASPLGESVPQAGQGFADTRLRFDYARRIQKSVAPLYTTQR